MRRRNLWETCGEQLLFASTGALYNAAECHNRVMIRDWPGIAMLQIAENQCNFKYRWNVYHLRILCKENVLNPRLQTFLFMHNWIIERLHNWTWVNWKHARNWIFSTSSFIFCLVFRGLKHYVDSDRVDSEDGDIGKKEKHTEISWDILRNSPPWLSFTKADYCYKQTEMFI